MHTKSSRHNDDPGLQFVLDNRRLIVGFALLIVLCGGFFILGFVEGKRQANPQEVAGLPGGPSAVQPSSPLAPGSEPQTSAVNERSTTESSPSSAQADLRHAETKFDAPSHPDASRQTPVVQSKPPVSTAVEYTVQVGAFRQRKEVDIKAGMLRAKGYDCTIEPPQAPDQLFLLQVGRYKTRAEAVRMQLKLRNDGSASFIKSR